MARGRFRRDYNLKPRPVHPFYYVFRFLCRVFHVLYFRREVHGRKYLTKSGGGLLAVNHTSYVDPPLAGEPWPRPLAYLARDTLFGGGWATWVMNVCCSIPVRRGQSDIRALRRVVTGVQSGEVIVVFPEGTRSTDGQLQPAKVGSGMIAYRSRAKITPCYIDGAWGAWRKHSSWPRPVKIRVFYGRPFTPHDLYGAKAGRDTYQHISDLMLKRISRLQEKARRLRATRARKRK